MWKQRSVFHLPTPPLHPSIPPPLSQTYAHAHKHFIKSRTYCSPSTHHTLNTCCPHAHTHLHTHTTHTHTCTHTHVHAHTHATHTHTTHIASFPGRSHLQYLTAYSMHIRRGKAWEISLRAVTSGRQKVDTRGVVPVDETWSPFLYYWSEGWRPEH